jgi:hypothetical protein
MASSSFYKFDCFVEDVGQVLHDLNNDSLKILLTNTAPNAGDTVVDESGGVCIVKAVSNANEIAAGNGYTKGGAAIAAQGWSQSGGIAKLTGTKVQWSATGSVGPFRYAVLYNSSKGTSTTRPVIGYWDYGAAVTLSNGETFTVGNENDGTDWTATYPVLDIQ